MIKASADSDPLSASLPGEDDMQFISAFHLRGVCATLLGVISLFGSSQPASAASAFNERSLPFSPSSVTWAEQQKISGSDGAAGENAYVVLVYGQKAFFGDPAATVGSNAHQGAVYVFGQAGTTWVQQQKIVASDGAAFDGFGGSLAYDPVGGLVIGAANRKVGTHTQQGAIYTFASGAGGVWMETQELTASDGAQGDVFGLSIAMTSSAIYVGAPGRDSATQQGVGGAYIFQKASGTWTQTQLLLPSSNNAESFGQAIAANGTTFFVGAPYYFNGTNDIGAVYVYGRGLCSGTSAFCWSQKQLITPPQWPSASPYSVPASANFGQSIASTGTTLAVGAPYATFDWPHRYQGLVNVYSLSSGTWNATAQLLASDAGANDLLGFGLATDGTIILAGAPRNLTPGVAYSFELSGGVWSQQQEFQASDGVNQDQFGLQISLSGSTALIGAARANVGTHTGQGAAYYFTH